MSFKFKYLICILVLSNLLAYAQEELSLEAIYNSSKYSSDYQSQVFWISQGEAYITIAHNKNKESQLIKHSSKNGNESIFLSSQALTPIGATKALNVEAFSLSDDNTKVLIFTNSRKVWRSNTRGDYWLYDFKESKLSQIGKQFPASSLMFAKFSNDSHKVAYVHDFNIYIEQLDTGTTKQLTSDGSTTHINGTFDWVYEEEFGMRDGFSWSSDDEHIAFWQLDASQTGTFYMINTTDSLYSKPIPIQYPKVGQSPSKAKVGIINTKDGANHWIPIPGDPVQHYLPGMQWVSKDLLLIQQINRKQNQLIVYSYQVNSGELKKVYTENHSAWVDLRYPDISSNHWGGNDLLLTDSNKYFLRMTEGDAWRHVYKISIATGEKILLTPGTYDVAAIYALSDQELYFSASPYNATQRYLYSVPLNGKGKLKRVTPKDYRGVNTYDISPNGKYAIHNHSNTEMPPSVQLVRLPGHQLVSKLVTNDHLKESLAELELPKTSFFKVTTEEGIEIDGRITKPVDFDPNKKYPIVFNVYGEPWGQMATDSWIGMFDIYLASKGFVIIKMDNRGTPSLKGSQWRKSIYKKVGVINTRDQALAAKQVIKWPFVDKERISVWGWSGGGSMTLNLMFKYPELYQTGISIAPVSNQLLYNNVYQERYMGLSTENMKGYIAGSPVTYAKNLEGNLLLIHGTGDDNVHYQNAEYLINELIRNNKQFDMMSYPNRSHGIYEGENTSMHLYTLISNYLLEHNKE
ncbi:S9 family peptidase [Galbibacter sp.]|uniref:S9 family peptidase n=1 Tax=Galbibacter sp. TaxID=2918471 RepID=UPI002C530A1F|nr:DPP IV N-terminal domain-containing protein [Galbibacter sp.]HLV63728.1 DPP IV N-terminal domain-containing protein [Galbibacter sp.]